MYRIGMPGGTLRRNPWLFCFCEEIAMEIPPEFLLATLYGGMTALAIGYMAYLYGREEYERRKRRRP
ncbi:MAG: hypothetical protein OHK0029_06360 [Armatimonadaceae bacterium]